MKESSATDATAPGPIGMLRRNATILKPDAKAAGNFLQDTFPDDPTCTSSGDTFSPMGELGAFCGGPDLKMNANPRRKKRINARKPMTLARTIHMSLTNSACCAALTALSAADGEAREASIESVERSVMVGVGYEKLETQMKSCLCRLLYPMSPAEDSVKAPYNIELTKKASWDHA